MGYHCGYITGMTPSEALAAQTAGVLGHVTAQRYRDLTGEERLAIALDMYELSCDVTRSGIRAQCPDADDKEVEELLKARRRLAVGY